jgi:hypothetical protein
LGHIGRHSPTHAKEVADANVLSLMLFFYMSPDSTDDLKDKAKKALKKIIDMCSHLTALEPLIHIAPEKILKHILNQYIKNLDNNPTEKKLFVQNSGLKKLQELRSKVSEPLREKIDQINDKYPSDIIKFYSPDYAASLINKIGENSGE